MGMHALILSILSSLTLLLQVKRVSLICTGASPTVFGDHQGLYDPGFMFLLSAFSFSALFRLQLFNPIHQKTLTILKTFPKKPHFSYYVILMLFILSFSQVQATDTKQVKHIIPIWTDPSARYGSVQPFDDVVKKIDRLGHFLPLPDYLALQHRGFVWEFRQTIEAGLQSQKAYLWATKWLWAHVGTLNTKLWSICSESLMLKTLSPSTVRGAHSLKLDGLITHVVVALTVADIRQTYHHRRKAGTRFPRWLSQQIRVMHPIIMMGILDLDPIFWRLFDRRSKAVRN